MPIGFNEIPNNIRVPLVYAEFDSSRAVSGSSNQMYKNLVFGQKLAAGTAPADIPIRATNADKVGVLAGFGSMLHAMAVAHFAANDFTETIFLPLGDAAGNAATGTRVFSGTATASGVVYLMVAAIPITVAVQSGDTASDVATAVAAAVTAKTGILVSASAAAGTVTFTALNSGEFGNDIDIRVNYYDGEETVAGITISGAAMSGGTINPSIANGLAALGDEQYHIIVMPYTDTANIQLMEVELDSRFGPLRMNEGHSFSASKVSLSALSALGDSRNSKHITIVAASGFPNTSAEVAASAAAIVSKHGQNDPARPFQTLALPGILAPVQVDRFTIAENNILLHDGISTTYADAGGVVRLQRLITTYKTNVSGADDVSYLDINTLLTLSYIRYDYSNSMLIKFPRHKLGGDNANFGVGQKVVTPKVIKAFSVSKFRDWEEQGYVEDVEQFKNDLIVERNGQDKTRLDIFLPPNLVNQFRIGGVQIGFLL
ncbi:MAG: phage tail protein [Gammaproteobacteria bacterium]|nr:MAG: phage tail protein [Gammaproteobacteria bacterium]